MHPTNNAHPWEPLSGCLYTILHWEESEPYGEKIDSRTKPEKVSDEPDTSFASKEILKIWWAFMNIKVNDDSNRLEHIEYNRNQQVYAK